MDIYLKWNGITEEEDKAQITGFDITKGNAGYLRASYGMSEECGLLKSIFPEKFWKGEMIDADFKDLIKRAKEPIYSYLSDVGDKHESKEFNALKGILEGLNIDFEMGADADKKTYVKGVVSFLNLGLEKQKNGLEPKVHISY